MERIYPENKNVNFKKVCDAFFCTADLFYLLHNDFRIFSAAGPQQILRL